MPCSRRVLASRPVAGPRPRLTPAPRALVCLRASRGQDVACGVHVPVVRGPARAGPRADVQRLGLADGPAHRARPGRREPPVDPRERAPVPRAPCTRACRRTSTSPHRAPTGPGACAPDPTRPDPPRTTSLVLADDRGRQLVQPVPAGVPDPGVARGRPCGRDFAGSPSPAGGGRVPSARAAASRRPCGRSAGRRPSCPSDSTAKWVSPRSIPTSRSMGGSGASGTSTTNEAWYRPAASTVTVTDDASAGSSRDQRTGTSPIPGSRNRPPG